MKTVFRAMPVAVSCFLMATVACVPLKQPVETKKRVLFPPDEACNYPSNASVQKYRDLGGGSWQYSSYGDPGLDYDCGKSEKQLRWPFSAGEIIIEYGVVGNKDGAASVGYDYNVSAESPTAKEVEFRQDFVRLIDETVQEALKGGLPDAMKTNMMNLDSFNKPRTGQPERAEIGNGMIWMTRHRTENGKSWLIKIEICADKTLKCPL